MNEEPEFPEIAAIVYDVVEDPLPPRPTLWGVVGYWPQGKWWAIPSCIGWHYDRRGIEAKVIELRQRGWRGLKIIEIPGEENDE